MVDFDPFSESYYDDPFPIYARMRADAPALYLEKYDCFFLSRFQWPKRSFVAQKVLRKRFQILNRNH